MTEAPLLRPHGPVVVTGASGFIGNALVCELARRGCEVVAVARRPPAAAAVRSVRVADYAETPAPADATLIHLADIRSVAAAARLGTGRIGDAVATVERLLAKNFRRFLFASSGAVYDDAGETLRAPGDPTLNTSLYVRGKRACEEPVLVAGGVVVRLANVIGKDMAPNNALSDILAQIPGHGAVRVHDDRVVRDFLWIGDAVAGLIAVAAGSAPGIVNLGTGRGTAIGELARLALAASGEPGRPVVATDPSERPSRIVLDVSATQAAFGWRPETSLERALEMLLREAA